MSKLNQSDMIAAISTLTGVCTVLMKRAEACGIKVQPVPECHGNDIVAHHDALENYYASTLAMLSPGSSSAAPSPSPSAQSLPALTADELAMIRWPERVAIA